MPSLRALHHRELTSNKRKRVRLLRRIDRVCLSCGSRFQSFGAHHRCCERCRVRDGHGGNAEHDLPTYWERSEEESRLKLKAKAELVRAERDQRERAEVERKAQKEAQKVERAAERDKANKLRRKLQRRAQAVMAKAASNAAFLEAAERSRCRQQQERSRADAAMVMMLELRAQGFSFARIAEVLNERAVPTPRLGKWHSRTVFVALAARSKVEIPT